MTIFVRTAKELIDRVLNQSIEDSIAEDSGTFSGFFRNTKNSGQQRDLTRGLQKAIAEFTDAETDKDSLAALKEIISKTDAAVEKLRATKKWERGGLNKTLSNLNSSLDRYFRALSASPLQVIEKLDSEKLLKASDIIIDKEHQFTFIDVEDDDDPFNLLCAHAAYYLGEHVLIPPEEGVLAKIYETASRIISPSTAIELRAQKENCLITHILKCQTKLSGLDGEKPNFLSLRKTFVVETIQAIQRDNATICEESKPVDTIPVQVSFLAVARVKAPTIKPSRGRLKVAMDNAIEEIESRSPVEKKEAEKNLVSS